VDRDLVERGRRGDREAYELLARASARRLYGVAHRILRDADRAEDATQQALVRIWLDLPKLRDPDRFEAWTYRLVVHASLAEARRERHHNADVRLLDDLEMAGPDEGTAYSDRDLLERAFRALSPEHRVVVVLHHHVGLPLTEIAEILGIPYGTVGSRLHYAVRELRTSLAADQARIARGAQPA
jgi:RNA polymerase sigma-70 factor (ECF subfamily)